MWLMQIQTVFGVGNIIVRLLVMHFVAIVRSKQNRIVDVKKAKIQQIQFLLSLHLK